MEKSGKNTREIKKRLLNGDLLIWRLLGVFMDLVFVSLLWLVCSLPLITIGAAAAAAYDTVVHSIKRKEPGLAARFFATFKAELLRGALCTVVWALALALLMLLLVYVISLGDSPMSFIFLVNAIVLGVVVLGSLVWVFPMLGRFRMSAGRTMTTALRLVFARLPATLAMALALVFTAAVCFLWLFPLIVMPGLMWYFQAGFIEPAFSQYS